LLVNIELELKNNKAAKTDNLADTIDYDSLTQKLHAQAVKLNYDLVEKFASHMLAIILQDKKIKAAKIEVTKSKISKIFENVCVTLEAKNK
jgi:dihydroneopterin aldolase